MLKVAMLSYWHVHAWDYTKQLMARDDVKITAVWDEIPKEAKKNAIGSVPHLKRIWMPCLAGTMLTRWSSIPYQHA